MKDNQAGMLPGDYAPPGMLNTIYSVRQSSDSPLSEIISDRIRAMGPISFRDYMEMALYYPRLGYYNRKEEQIGKNGDYYTSPAFSKLYGEMLGRQIEEMWSLLEKQPFTIVEFGAGMGSLCLDILSYLKQNPALYEQLRYCIIEKSESLFARQNELFHEKVYWYDSIEAIAPINGCVIANEVVDNFSVHQVVMQDELMEVFVDHQEGFAEMLFPATDDLKNYFSDLNITLPTGFRTEVNLEAIEWVEKISAALNKGWLLTIDYGHPSLELYCSKRSKGTVLCYYKHNINDDPYINIGSQDITSHINFSALDNWGTKAGLQQAGFCSQAHFLHGIGLTEHIRQLEKTQPAKENENMFLIYTLLMDMGNKFRVLIQQKGVEKVHLSGMRFSQKLI